MMTTITHLPDQVITIILKNKNISVEDILSLKSTCKRLYQIRFSNNFWEKKFYQRFPFSKRKRNKEILKNSFYHLETSVKYIEKLLHYVSLMSSNNLRGTKETEMNSLLRSIARSFIIYCFVLDDIYRIISTQLSWYDSNLTLIYNFGLIFHWIRQYRLTYKQIQFIRMPKKKLLLEKQVIIIAQYFHSYVPYSIIDRWLNDIVQIVLFRLKNKYATHSVFSTSSKQFTFWRNNNINDNFWNPMDANQIISLLEETIFSELGIHQLYQLLITLDVPAKYIDYIIEHYEKCLLSITYHCVARRLGIHCFLNVMDDGKPFVTAIIWKPKYLSSTEDCQLKEYSYMMEIYPWIHPSNIRKSYFDPHSTDPLCDISQMLKSMFNFRRDFCELTNHCQFEAYNNIFYNWKIKTLINFLSRLSDNNNNDNIQMNYEYKNITSLIKDKSNIVINEQLEIRREKVKFTIGMIVTHSTKSYSTDKYKSIDKYHHTGVIIGWHYKCKVMFVRKKLNSLVPHLSECCDNQHVCLCISQTCNFSEPHYIILTENNKICYVPQDTVSIGPLKFIKNIEIGRYFSKFEVTHYVPNENLAKNYPTDIAIMHEIFSNQ